MKRQQCQNDFGGGSNCPVEVDDTQRTLKFMLLNNKILSSVCGEKSFVKGTIWMDLNMLNFSCV